MSTGRPPPRYVPTLTEVVAPPDADTATTRPAALEDEQLVHRVLQRIDLTLDRRLREAIASVVLEQTRALGPLLRDEIEAVVRETVSQALADELNAQPRN